MRKPKPATSRYLELLDQVFRSGERFVGHEVPIDLWDPDTPERQRRFIDFICAPITDEHGRVTGIFVEGHDVTARVETEMSLRGSERRFRAVANLGPDMLWSNEADGRLAWFNQRRHDYTGLSYEELDRDGLLAATHPATTAMDYLASGLRFRMEISLARVAMPEKSSYASIRSDRALAPSNRNGRA